MIAIIQYNAGNVQSVQNALRRLGHDAVVSNDHDVLRRADKILFPGVGNAGAAMKDLEDKGLDKLIPSLTQPLLGICVGMQLLCRYSEESGTKCLGIIDAGVKQFTSSALFKVPQVGWNNIYDYKTGLLHNVKENAFVYYVHSYYVELCDATVATTDYILPYSAVIQKNNFYGVQFHAEKSAAAGDQLLKNFLDL